MMDSKINDNAYQIEKIASIIAAESIQINYANSTIRTLCYDSRKISDPHHALFFALSGRRDGHQFLADIYKAGIRNFVVRRGAYDTTQYTDCNILEVRDPLEALQKLAAYHRRQFNYPVIAITGSNGKTIVKEWLYQLLSPEYRIIRSPKSYNSQLGVPLSLWQMGQQYDLAIIEAGISRQGEMEHLATMIQPTMGVLTNLGHAHDEGFTSAEEKIHEKIKLFAQANQVVFSPQYLASNILTNKEKFTWGTDVIAKLQILDVQKLGRKDTLLKAIYKGEEVSLTVPFIDKAALENSICCWAVMLAMGYETTHIAQRMQRLLPVHMRLVLKKGLNNCSIIDDSYSNDLSSLEIALDFLKQQQQHPQRILILSDLPLEKDHEQETYQQIATLLEEKLVDKLIAVGETIQQYASLFNVSSHFYSNTEQLLKDLQALGLSDSTILIKGARTFSFERISKVLTLQTHETTLEINLNALEHNLNAYKALLKDGTKLMVMVKAFSYGSGSFEIANLLQFNKVDYLTVAYVDEGITLRNSGIKLPIVVMSPGINTFEQIIQHQLEPEIYSFYELQSFIHLLMDKAIKDYPVHIKLDTGMHRLGFEPDDLKDLLARLQQTDAVRVKSIFSHLAASGDPQHDVFTREQIHLFSAFTKQLREHIGYDFIRHIANTAAISRFPEAQFDMVRLGIGLYGVAADSEKPLLLQPVTQLKTGITQIKHIKPGETIGYNRHGKLNGEGKIATVKIGYADGYSRRLGNGVGKMMIDGQLVPTVGDICMDMCMLDITDIDAVEGDEVLVIGQELSVEVLAAETGTIPYEILTNISQRVRRVYYYE